MKYDFETIVSRQNIGNIKDVFRPKPLKDKDFISFAGAEFDFKTAPSVIEAVVQCAQNGLLGFTTCTEAYLNQVIWWMQEARTFTVNPRWIVPTNGTIFSLATALRAFTSSGDGMIMFAPEYYRYKSTALRNGRTVASCPLIQSELTYEIDFALLEELMAVPANKMLVFSNPANPIGRIWTKDELARIAILAARHDVVVFSDEIFAEVAFNGLRVTPYIEAAGEGAHCLVSTSLGKAFSFTGVNHANLIISDEATRTTFTTQRDIDHFGSIDPVLHAAMFGAYSPEGLAWLSEMVTYVHENYIFLKGWLAVNLPEIRLFDLEGSYVAWLDLSGLGLCDKGLAHFLDEQALFHMDSGDSYGGSAQFRRINIATPRQELVAALSRLAKAVAARGAAAWAYKEACHA